MKAICKNGFSLEECDDNGFPLENKYFVIEDNSIWNIEDDNFRMIGGEIRLTNHEGVWIELSKEHFDRYFKIVTSKVHELKIIPEYFESVKNGNKTFEVRKNDRGFGVGDILTLKEYSGDNYTGRKIDKRVSYILGGGKYGIDKNYVVLGIR